MGHEVYLIANDGNPSEVKEGITIISAGRKVGSRLRRILLSGRRMLNTAIELDADIYMIHDPEMIPTGLRLIRRGKKVLYDAHENFPKQLLEKEWIPNPLRRPLSYFAELYFRMTMPKFDYITTVTPDIYDVLIKYNQRVEVLCNFPIIEVNEKKATQSDFMQRKNVLCYAGTVYPYSSQESILDAIEDMEGVEYFMIGTIDPSYKSALGSRKGWKKVTFVDRVDRAELLKYYQSATLGLVILDYMPNLGKKRGSLGNNKIFEYMSAGLPIICTDFELWSEIVDTYKCGICVNPRSPSEIKDAIRTLVGDRKLAYEMGRNGRRAVEQEFNWDTQKRKFERVIASFE
jgi:glycosyltransferase involved in cell wall biosynthesis